MFPISVVGCIAFSPNGTRVLTGSSLWVVLDAQKLSNPSAEAQIMLFVQQNRLTKEQTPKNLVAKLSDYAKSYLWGESGRDAPLRGDRFFAWPRV